MIIERVVNQLEIDEGKKPLVYKDSKGNDTVGIGHKVLHGEVFDHPLSDQEMYDLLHSDIHRTVKNMNIVFPWWGNLSEDMQDAFVNMAFNMGCETLLTFHTFLDLLRDGEYIKASEDLTTTLWHKQVGDRAVRIEQVFAGGDNGGQSSTA